MTRGAPRPRRHMTPPEAAGCAAGARVPGCGTWRRAARAVIIRVCALLQLNWVSFTVSVTSLVIGFITRANDMLRRAPS